jgi:hypothetical protein
MTNVVPFKRPERFEGVDPPFDKTLSESTLKPVKQMVIKKAAADMLQDVLQTLEELGYTEEQLLRDIHSVDFMYLHEIFVAVLLRLEHQYHPAHELIDTVMQEVIDD